jgi:uncharacterized repeat protein (TIGR02543 family)
MTDFMKSIWKKFRLVACFGALSLLTCVEIPEYAVINVKVSRSDGGTVSINPPGPEYRVGTKVTFTAKPANGYAFKNWTGDVPDLNAKSESSVVTFTVSGDKYDKYNDKTVTANFVRVYTLTVNNDQAEGGGTTHDGITVHDSGMVVAVTATQKPGYRFDRWSGADTSIIPTVTVSMNSNKTLTAHYVRMFTLDVVPPCCGTVRVTVNGNTVSTPKDLDSGTVVSVTVTPSSDHKFTDWSGAPSSVNLTSPSITFSMKDNYSLRANFGRMYNLTVVVSPSGGGTVRVTVNGSPITISPNGEAVRIDSGASVSATATATENDRYRFEKWLGADTSTSPTVTITMNSDNVLTANFVRIFTLTVNNNPENGGTTTRDVSTVWDAGTPVTVTATSKSGYRFDKWSGADTSIIPTVTVSMNSNKTLTANYKRIFKLNVPITPPNGGTVNVTVANGDTISLPALLDTGTVVNVTLQEASGYKFTGWVGRTPPGINMTSRSIKFTMNNDYDSLEASCKRTYTLTVGVSPPGGGTVRVITTANGSTIMTVPPIGTDTLDVGTAVTVTANPNSGYEFENWTEAGAEISKSATCPITMNGNKTLTANFKLIVSEGN